MGRSSRPSEAPTARRLAHGLLLFAASALALGSAPADPGELPVRLRFQWTGEKPEVWAGVLETSQGTFVRPVSLGVGADDAGTLWADGKSLWLARRGPAPEDGFEVTVVGPTSARLSFTLQNATAGGARHQWEWTLAEVRKTPQLVRLGERQAHLAVCRAPGDELRIAIDRPHLIFAPGEILKAVVAPDPTDSHISQKGSLEWEVAAPHAGAPLTHGSLPVPAQTDIAHPPRLPVEIPLPENEGAFDIRFRLNVNGTMAGQSAVQVLVLGLSTPAAASSKPADVLVDHFRPGDAKTARLIDRGSSADWLRPRRLERVGPLPGGLGAANSDASGPAVNWLAYRLELRHPQQPHRLVVEMAAGASPFVGLSVVEPNGNSRSVPFTLESGIAAGPSLEFATGDGASASRTVVRREVLFWPRVREPILLLHDMGTGGRIKVASVEVHELGSLGGKRKNLPAGQEERLVGPYIDKPTFVASLGAPQAFDKVARRNLDDWETFHAAALRAAGYLRARGDNSLMLTVLAEGSALYPSPLLESTPRYDTGTLSSSGHDPLRKDVVELLYRVFDRERLVLIPELIFSTPLPALERQLAGSSPASEGIELVDAEGQSARALLSGTPGSAPFYNPLDPRVQTAVLDVVREFVERYRRHPSFRGIALEIDCSGFLELPGLEWGADDVTLARFRKETGVEIDGGPGAEPAPDRGRRRRELLTGEARARWVAWRSSELARFYRRLAEAVTSAGPNARLVLACKQVLPSNSESEIHREIRLSGRFGDLLPQRGLDFSLLDNVPRLIVLRPAIWRTTLNPEQALLDEAVNENASFAAAFHRPESGVLALHRPQECRVCGIAGGGPSGATSIRLAVHASGCERENRRRFVRALAADDAQILFEGGWMTPLGQEDDTRDLRQIMRALPASPFYKVESDDQPVIVRVARRQKKTYIYAASPFAEPVQLGIQLTCPAGTACRALGPSRAVTIEAAAEGSPSRIDVPLDGYGLAAWEIDCEDVRVPTFRAELSAPAIASLKAKIQRFGRLADVRRANQPQKDSPGLPLAPGDPVSLAAGTDRPDSSTSEPPEHERFVSGAAYWSFDRKGSRVGPGDALPIEGEPLSADDLRQLAKISLEIKLASDEQRFAECQRLLDSYWGRYLLLESEGAGRKGPIREAHRPREASQ